MGGGGGKSSEQRGQDVLPFARMFEGETRGVRRDLMSQIQEALASGGVGARLPLVQNAVSQAQGALGQSLRGAESQLAQMGLQGTPFAASQLGNMRMQGQQQIAAIGPGLTQQFIGMGGQVAGALPAALMQAVSGVGSGQSKQGRGGIMTS